MLRPKFFFTVYKSVRAVIAVSGSQAPRPPLSDSQSSQSLSISLHTPSLESPSPANLSQPPSQPQSSPQPQPQPQSSSAPAVQSGVSEPPYEAPQDPCGSYALYSAPNAGPSAPANAEQECTAALGAPVTGLPQNEVANKTLQNQQIVKNSREQQPQQTQQALRVHQTQQEQQRSLLLARQRTPFPAAMAAESAAIGEAPAAALVGPIAAAIGGSINPHQTSHLASTHNASPHHSPSATSAFLSPFVSLASSFKRLFKRRSSPEPALQPQQHDVAGLVPEAAQQARKRGVPELETARTSQNGISSRISSAAGIFLSQPPRPLQLSSSLADATGTAGRRPHAAHAGVADGGLAERAGMQQMAERVAERIEGRVMSRVAARGEERARGEESAEFEFRMEDVVLDSGIRDLGHERGKGRGGAERRMEVAKKGRGQWRKSGSSGSLTSSSRASGAAAAGGGGGFVSTAGAGGAGGASGAGGAGVGNAVYRARTLNFYAAPPTPASVPASGAVSGVASAPGVASGAAGAAVAPRSPLQQGYRGGYGQHKQQTQRGMAQQGMAQQGVAQQGMAQQGMAQQGMAQQGMAQQGMVRQGMAQQGMAQQGMAQQGMARQGMAQQGMAQAQGSGGVGHVWRPGAHIPRTAVPAPLVPAPRVQTPRAPSAHVPAPPVPAPLKAPAPIAAAAAATSPLAGGTAAAAPPPPPIAKGMAVTAGAPIPLHTPAAVRATVPAARAAAGAAAARAAGPRGKREASREKDRNMVAFLLNMLTSLQPSPPSANPLPPSAPPMPTSSAFSHPLVSNPVSSPLPPPHRPPPSHPAVSPTHLGAQDGRLSMEEMLARLQQQWQAHRAGSTGTSKNGKKKSKKRAGAAAGGETSRNGQEELVSMPTGNSIPGRSLGNVRAFHVSEALKNLWDADAGLALFRWAKDVQGVKPDVYVYSTLFGLLGRGRDAANLARVVEEMREDGCGHNAVTLQSLATAYGRAGRWDEALATLGTMQDGDGGQSVPHDLTLIGPRVDTLFRMGRYVDAIKAFTELRSARHVPDSFVYNTVLTCYGRVGNSAGAEEAFKDMIRHGVPLDVRCANSLMDAYGRTGRVDDAMAVFDRMCLAAVAASEASHMKGGGGGGLARERGGNRSNADLPGAAAVAGIPALIPHVAADNASTLHGSAARAVCTSAAAEAVSITPAPLSTTSTTATTGTVTSIPFSRAFAWPAPDQITYSCAIHLLSMAGRLTEAEETFEAMLVVGKRPDTITWSTMVQMWAKEANPERAVMWFKRMVAAGCRPETPAYNSLMWAFVGRGMFDEAGEVLTALKNGWDLVGQVELVGRGEEQESKQGGSGKSVFGWLNPRGEGELGLGDANKGVAGAVSPSKQGNAKLELAPNLMTYTMFLSECTESAAHSDVARLLRLMEETEHAAHTVFQLLTEEPFESTHTLLPAGAESDSESAPLSGAVCEAGSAAGCEASDGETRRCERESEGGRCEEVGWGAVRGMIERGLVEVEVRGMVGEWEEERWREVERRMRESAFSQSSAESQRAFADACIAFLHRFGRHERAARMWNLCHTRLRLYPCSIQLPAISGQGGECFVDLHGMSAGTAVTVTKWALEKMRQAVVASAAAGAASGASAASSSVASTVAISSTAANPTASGETAEGAIQGEEALVESLSPSESGAAESSRLHESPPAHPLQWQQPSKVAVVTGWGKRSRVQGASLVKAAVEALLLRDLTAPFSLHRFHPGSYEAPGADLEHWLLSPGVEQLLAPRDEG
ncbi:unnamed protein product [Closterium sp. NIES-53]